MLKLLLAALIAAGPVAALADTPLKRLTLRHDLLGFEAVGRLDAGGGFCSGALIAPNLVLTAAHCLIDSNTGERRDPTEIRFRAGLRDGEALYERRGKRAVTHPEYRSADPNGLRQLRSDVALLELESPIPSDQASPFAMTSGPGTGGQVSVVSYARDRSEAPSYQRACDVTVRAQEVFVMTCDTHFGSSGAPVFDMASGRPQIVSLISRGNRENGKSTVYGMEIGPALSATQAALRSGRGVWPEGSFTARRLTIGTGTSLQGGSSGGALFLKP